jgi:hypothetical protein
LPIGVSPTRFPSIQTSAQRSVQVENAHRQIERKPATLPGPT